MSVLPDSISIKTDLRSFEYEVLDYLNKVLSSMEQAPRITLEILMEIQDEVRKLVLLAEEREEINLRINWLKHLHDVMLKVPLIKSQEEAKHLRNSLRYVGGNSFVKKEIISELERLEIASPKAIDEIKNDQSPYEYLMEQAIEYAGELFINLGSTGRKTVVYRVLELYGEKASLEDVINESLVIEQDVKHLLEYKDSDQIMNRLDQLPLESFNSLEIDRKKAVVAKLIQTKSWTGLASLNRVIKQLNKEIEKEEHEKTSYLISSLDGKVATTMDIRHLKESGKVQLSSGTSV